ncbi:uncharacterized protein LOC117786939 [Drosophila innubila]|uniref:uncharacterized protein LOC117786939 n=1 Tax=Drosophila innubila TaxID=198719 RepID=UPI00148E8E07|nr:uncharacterized protein LOC117786939 [Drosophila innubila]
MKQIIARNVPQLVNLLLNSKEQEQDHVKYEECVNYGVYMLTNYNRPPCKSESVLRNMADFVERFQLEQLEELGETIKMLSLVVVDDKHCPEDLKYSVLEFMLSVNFKAFRTARINFKEIMLRRSNLLESLAMAYKQREEPANSSDYRSNSVRRPLDLELEVRSFGNSSLSDSMNLSLDLSLDLSIDTSQDSVGSSTEQQQLVNEGQGQGQGQGQVEQADDQAARQSFWLALMQLQQESQEPCNQEYDADNSVQLNRTHPLGSFAVSFADYLRRPLQDEELGEEAFLLQELLAMFFQPCDCRHFELVDQLIQLRSTATCNNSLCALLQQFLRPLQYMQLLQLFIDCHEHQMETLTCLTAALRRLLKPVVESLTHFEQRVASGKEQATLHCLLRATKHSFQRLQLLWHLSVASYVWQPQQQILATHIRSQRIICNLLTLITADSKLDRGSAAALLLHVLQVYCQFLDSWWQLGEFQDCLEEFPAMRLEFKGHSEYVMRELSLENCSISGIIEQHIKSAGISLALLYDSRRLSDFVGIHRCLLKKSLHHTLVKCVLQQLKSYQLKAVKKVSTAPDIFKQLKSTENEQLRSLYYAYYKESLLDFKQPLICGIDELLQQCQNCVSYTPFHQLICLSLERLLEERVLLINAFVLHLLRVELQLAKVLGDLRSVYLLLNFRVFGSEIELALEQLQQGLIPSATEQLQSIVDSQNTLQGHQFLVTLPSADLQQLSILYSCDPALSCIITDSQLQTYNIACRQLLQLNIAIRKLQQLPELPCDPVAVASLLNLKIDLELSLAQHLKTKQLQQAAAQCDEHLQHCVSVPQLQQLHAAFVQQTSDILLTHHDVNSNLQELLMLATILAKHWQRLQRVLAQSTECGKLNDFEAHYSEINKRYLLSINRLSESMQCLLAWPKADGQ